MFVCRLLETSVVATSDTTTATTTFIAFSIFINKHLQKKHLWEIDPGGWCSQQDLVSRTDVALFAGYIWL